MPDEPNNPSSTTTEATPAPTGTQALGNDQSARNQDGSLKDNQAAPTQATSKDSDGSSKNSDQSTTTKSDTSTAKAPQGAPEAYSDFKAPDGYEIDKATVDKAAPIFKELNLSQDQAQKLVDFYATVSKDAAEAPFKAFEDLRAEWRDKVVKDPALGDGKSDLKPEVRAVIGRAVDALPADVAKEFREALVLTGAGDNPAFVKAFYNLASMLGEGTLVKGGGPSPAGQTAPNAPRSAAQALFPNLPSANR